MLHKRTLLIMLALLCALFFTTPTFAGAGAGNPVTITTGKPRKSGTVTIKISCQRTGGAEVEVVNVRVYISGNDSAEKKAERIRDKIADVSQDCFTVGGAGSQVTLTPKAANLEITKVAHNLDKTNELFGIDPAGVTASLVSGTLSLDGFVQGNGMVMLQLPTFAPAFVETLPSMTPELIWQQMAQQLGDQGAEVIPAGRQLHFFSVPAVDTIWVDNSDLGLAIGLEIVGQDVQLQPLNFNGRRLTAIVDGSGVQLFNPDGSPVGQPINGAGRPVVAGIGRLLLVTDDNSVRFFDADGNQQGNAVTTLGRAEVVATDGGCIIMIDDDSVRIYDQDGNKQGNTITTNGRATVIVDGDRIVVIDADSVRIYDKAGNKQGNTITTTGRATVIVAGDRIIVIDDDSVRIYDRDGNKQGNTITTTGRAEVIVTKDGCIIVIDDDSVRIYDKDGNQQGNTITTTGRAKVIVAGGRIIVIDDDSVRIYDKAGNKQGNTITTTGRATVIVKGDRIVVIDDDSVRIYDKDGNQQGNTITTTGRAEVIVTADGCIIVIDDDSVRIYDKAGNKQGNTITTTGRATVIVDGDRIVVIDDDSVRIYDKGGNKQGNTITTTGRATVIVEGGRIIVIDDDSVRIYDRNGNKQGNTITTTGRADVIVTADGCIIVIDDDSVRIFDKDGNQQGNAILTAGRATVQVEDERIIVITDGGARIYDKAGNQIGNTIPTTGRPSVLVLDDGCVVVIDDDGVQIFDGEGNLVGVVGTIGRSHVTPLGNLLLITNEFSVLLVDKQGNVLVNANTTMPPAPTVFLPPPLPLPELDPLGMLGMPHLYPDAAYDFWRLPDPFMLPGDPAGQLLQSFTPPSDLLGQPLQHQDLQIDSFFDICYRIEVHLPDQLPPLVSDPVCKATQFLLPGWNLVTPQLWNGDGSADSVLPEAFGTADPLTADRLLVWNAATQSYESAWFCAGACEDFGEEYYQHWLNDDYSRSTIMLPPSFGFWYENRSGDTLPWTTYGAQPLPQQPSPSTTFFPTPVEVEPGWNLLGNSSVPLTADQLLLHGAFGSADPLTADRLLVWNAETQSYEGAFYCGGTACEAFGDDFYQKWLTPDYGAFDQPLAPGDGFWYQHHGVGYDWHDLPYQID